MSDHYQVPEPDEITAPWWEATADHRLLVQRCQHCGHTQHPPRALCTGCGATDTLGWQQACGAGVVDAATVVHVAPLPELIAPYVVGRILLPEGVRLLAGISVDPPRDVPPGTSVQLRWRDLPDGRALPMFTVTDPTNDEAS